MFPMLVNSTLLTKVLVLIPITIQQSQLHFFKIIRRNILQMQLDQQLIDCKQKLQVLVQILLDIGADDLMWQ